MFYFLGKLPVHPFEIKRFLPPILEDEMQISWHFQISWLPNK